MRAFPLQFLRVMDFLNPDYTTHTHCPSHTHTGGHLLWIGPVTLRSLLGPAVTDVLSEVLSPSLHPRESSERQSRETRRQEICSVSIQLASGSILHTRTHTHTKTSGLITELKKCVISLCDSVQVYEIKRESVPAYLIRVGGIIRKGLCERRKEDCKRKCKCV